VLPLPANLVATVTLDRVEEPRFPQVETLSPTCTDSQMQVHNFHLGGGVSLEPATDMMVPAVARRRAVVVGRPGGAAPGVTLPMTQQWGHPFLGRRAPAAGRTVSYQPILFNAGSLVHAGDVAGAGWRVACQPGSM
jgi:hypothetical protein